MGAGRPTAASGGRLVSLVDGKEYTVPGGGLVIGRDAACDVVVENTWETQAQHHLYLEPNGCVAEVQMEDNLVKQLRTGTSATFIIFQTPEEGIGIPMGLKGFGEGYDKLP